MHKQMNLLLIGMMTCSSLCGMDGNNNLDVKTLIVSKIDFKTSRSLATVNKTYNKIIEENFRPYKKYIESCLQEKGTEIIPGDVSWNYNFSKCACVTIGSIENNRKSWRLTVVGLTRDGKVRTGDKKWSGFYFPAIEDNIRPFFNKQGQACFHGYADVWIKPNDYHRLRQSIVQVSIDLQGETECYRCFIEAGENKDDVFSFNILCNFPVLMRAFLQSKKVREHLRDIHDGWDHAQYYNISGVTLPKDYKICKKKDSGWTYDLMQWNNHTYY